MMYGVVAVLNPALALTSSFPLLAVAAAAFASQPTNSLDAVVVRGAEGEKRAKEAMRSEILEIENINDLQRLIEEYIAQEIGSDIIEFAEKRFQELVEIIVDRNNVGEESSSSDTSVEVIEENQLYDDPYDSPLIKAINRNDAEALEVLLKQGKKPDLRYAFTGFGDNDTDPKILDLLDKYDALPEGVSLSTLKFTLFAMGNSRITTEDFLSKPDLNLNGIPQKRSPMTFFVRSGNINYVAFLIREGVQERPIDYVFSGVHPAYFMGCDLLDIGEFKQRVSDNLAGRTERLPRLEYQCKMAELLLSNPTEELDKVFEQEKDWLYHQNRFLTLFAWAAKNNRADLLDLFYFKKLFQEDKSSAKEAVVVAAAFSSKEFIVKAIQENLLDESDIRKVATIAAASDDIDLLGTLIKIHFEKEEGNLLDARDIRKSDSKAVANNDVGLLATSIKTHREREELEGKQALPQTTRKVSGIYYIESTHGPMFWSVRNGHKSTTELLLKFGASPNKVTDNFMGASYLQVAAACGHIGVMELLMSYGADINHQHKLGGTALHSAAYRNKLEALEMLIKAGADTELTNYEGQKALDTIKDEVVRQKAQEAVANRLEETLSRPPSNFVEYIRRQCLRMDLTCIGA